MIKRLPKNGIPYVKSTNIYPHFQTSDEFRQAFYPPLFKGCEIRYFKRSDAAEINAILARIPGWKRCDKAMRMGIAYGVQKGFIRRNLS